MKSKFLTISLLLLLCTCGSLRAQFYSLRVNVLELATTTINAELGMVLNDRWSIHLPVTYNPWTFGDNKKIKNISVRPGVRFWMRESEGSGWFFGGNAIVSRYNQGGFFGNKYRRDGMSYGLGITGGYSIVLTKKFNLEFEGGVGGVFYNEDKYLCHKCGTKISEPSGIRLVPNKLAVNLVYLF